MAGVDELAMISPMFMDELLSNFTKRFEADGKIFGV
jgi:hypothetical protein